MTNRLISKIIFAGLVIGTLPMSLPAQAQATKSVSRAELKMEVAREVAKIQKTVKRLRAARIAIPSVIVGAGLLLTAVVAAITAILFLIPKNKIKKARQMILKQIGPGEGISVQEWKGMQKILPKPVSQTLSSKLKFYRGAEFFKNPNATRKKIAEVVAKDLKSDVVKLSWLARGSQLITAVIFGTVFAAISIGTLFGLSAARVAAAFRSAKRLDQIKKEHPGILTPQQEKVLAKLKKISASSIGQGIIKNLRLEDALKMAVNKVMKQKTLIAALGGQKKARKTFAKYIKLSWQKELFEKTLSEGSTSLPTEQSLSRVVSRGRTGLFKSMLVKARLRQVNRRLARLERKHSQLKKTLTGAVQQYSIAANEILQELKRELVEESKKQKVTSQPMIQL